MSIPIAINYKGKQVRESHGQKTASCASKCVCYIVALLTSCGRFCRHVGILNIEELLVRVFQSVGHIGSFVLIRKLKLCV